MNPNVAVAPDRSLYTPAHQQRCSSRVDYEPLVIPTFRRNMAYSLNEMQNNADQGKLLKMVLSNCSTDGVTILL
jgi:hypothetical protein